MRRPVRTLLPNPYVPYYPYLEISSGITSALVSGSLGGSNNDAVYVPTLFPCDTTLFAIRFGAGNGTGNYDLGLYDDTFSLLASSGSTAMTAAGVKTLTLSELRVEGGRTYYMALALSSTSGNVARYVYSANFHQAVGGARQASALPLPSTATPATQTGTNIPLFAFGVR